MSRFAGFRSICWNRDCFCASRPALSASAACAFAAGGIKRNADTTMQQTNFNIPPTPERGGAKAPTALPLRLAAHHTLRICRNQNFTKPLVGPQGLTPRFGGTSSCREKIGNLRILLFWSGSVEATGPVLVKSDANHHNGIVPRGRHVCRLAEAIA